MSDFAPLDELGRALAAALERDAPRIRRRRRVVAAAVALSVAVAIPAAGAVSGWAGLAGGETPLPTQVPDGLRVGLAGASDARGPWRLEAYRAALAGSGGRVGTCVFATRTSGGTGRCLARGAMGLLVDTGQDPVVAVAAGVVRGAVARVEVTVTRDDGERGRVIAVTPASAPADRLAARDLPADLRAYAVVLDDDERGPVGVRALAPSGQTLAVSGKPAPASPRAPARPTPFAAERPRP